MKILSKFELDGDIVSLIAIPVNKIKHEKGMPENTPLSVEDVADIDVWTTLKKEIQNG